MPDPQELRTAAQDTYPVADQAVASTARADSGVVLPEAAVAIAGVTMPDTVATVGAASPAPPAAVDPRYPWGALIEKVVVGLLVALILFAISSFRKRRRRSGAVRESVIVRPCPELRTDNHDGDLKIRDHHRVYLPRASDDEIRQALSAGDDLLIVGKTGLGKSRGLYEALVKDMRAAAVIPEKNVGSRLLLDAVRRLKLPRGTRHVYLILDDVDRYVARSIRIDDLVAELRASCPCSCSVVMTLRCEEKEPLYRAMARARCDTVNGATPVTPPDLGSDEAARLAKEVGSDTLAYFDGTPASVMREVVERLGYFDRLDHETQSVLVAVGELRAVGLPEPRLRAAEAVWEGLTGHTRGWPKPYMKMRELDFIEVIPTHYGDRLTSWDYYLARLAGPRLGMAFDALVQALELRPCGHEIGELADIKLDEGDKKKARELYQRADRLGGNLLSGSYRRWARLEAEGDAVEADRIYSKAVAAYPGNMALAGECATHLVAMADGPRAERVFDDALKRARSTNDLDQLLTQAPTWPLVQRVLMDKRAKHLPTSAAAYGRVINHAPDWAAARDLLTKMLKAKLKPANTQFNVVLGHAPDDTARRRILKDMASVGSRPDLYTYSLLIGGAPDYARAREYFARMQAEQLTPNEVTLNVLLGAADDWKTACAIIEEFAAFGVSPNLPCLMTTMKKDMSGVPLAEILDWFYKGYHPEAVVESLAANLRDAGRLDDVMELVYRYPHLPVCVKFVRERTDFALDDLYRRWAADPDHENSSYALGIALLETGAQPPAGVPSVRKLLEHAMTITKIKPREAALRERLKTVV